MPIFLFLDDVSTGVSAGTTTAEALTTQISFSKYELEKYSLFNERKKSLFLRWTYSSDGNIYIKIFID